MLENVWDISKPGNLIWDGPTHFFPTTLCGVLVFDSVSRASSSSSARLLRSHFVTHHLWHNFVQHHLCHTPTFTPNFVTHQLSNTTLSHTIFDTQLWPVTHQLSHPTLSHTNFQHNFVTHHLWHTTFTCHTPTFTPNFVTHQLSTQLCHTLSLTHNFDQHHLWHTTLSHTIFPTQLCHTHQLSHTTLSHTIKSHMAQCHIHLRFTWQAWRNVTSTFVLRGRRGAYGTGWRAWAGLVARDAAALCVAGVAQCHIHLRFTWQAWRNVISTFVLRGTRGTYDTGWRAWAGFSRLWRRGTLRGRRGTMSYPPSCHVACVAHCHIHLCFAWHAWHLWHWVARLGWF